MRERWTADRVLDLAPDSASQRVGTRLAAERAWSGLGFATADGGVPGLTGLWGTCGEQRTAVVLTDVGSPLWSCTCGTARQPCGHGLALALLWAEGRIPQAAPPPDWAGAWLAERRGAAPVRPARTAPGDPGAALRRAERRAGRVADGVAELRHRLADQVQQGLAETDPAAVAQVAARMIDAQAPGLAAYVRSASAVPGSGEGWPERLLEDYALLWLLLNAYERIDELPDEAAAVVRTRVGWPTTGSGPAVRDRWTVLGARDRIEDHLVVRNVWLRGSGSGRTARLASYGAAGQAPSLSLPAGAGIDADVVFHDGPVPVGATLGELHDAADDDMPEPEGVGVDQAVDVYATALRDEPWLESCPVVLAEAVPVPDPLGWRIVGADGFWVPVDRTRTGDDALWRLAALSGGAGLTVFGEYGARGFAPVTAWHEGRAVELQ